MNNISQYALDHSLSNAEIAMKKQPVILKQIDKSQKRINDFLSGYGGSEINYMRYSPSMFKIEKSNSILIEKATIQFHRLIEKIFDLLAGGHNDLRCYFNKHEKFFPYFNKLKTYWQSFGRYDFLLNAKGVLQFIETNASGGTGFFYLNGLHQISLESFTDLGMDISNVKKMHSYEDPDYFAKQIIKMEKINNIYPENIGILFDHNNNLSPKSIQAVELTMMQKAFQRCGRNSLLSHVENSVFANGFFSLHKLPISISFNKFRLSDREQPWCDIILNKYSGFLKGIERGCFQPVNSIPCLTVGEDKSILALLFDKKFQDLFDKSEKSFIQSHIPWTARLGGDVVATFQGKEINLMDLLIQNKNEFVIKPENGRRGLDVFIGKSYAQEDWVDIVKRYKAEPFVMQYYINPLKLPTLYKENNKLHCHSLSYTGSTYHVNGEFAGMLSRVSTEDALNVRENGFILPTIIGSQ